MSVRFRQPSGARKSRVAELQAEMEELQTERKHLIAYAQMTHPGAWLHQ